MDSISLAGTVLTLVFGIASIFFYLRSRAVKEPVFVIKDWILQTRNHPKIRVYFDNQRIESLSQARILFFNNGNKEIRREDIPKSGFPTITVDGDARILSSELLVSSAPEINFRINVVSQTEIILKFDYLNPGDGAVLELLYDQADPSADEDLEEDSDAESSEALEDRPTPISCRAAIIGGRPSRIWDYSPTPNILTIAFSYLLSGFLLFGSAQMMVHAYKTRNVPAAVFAVGTVWLGFKLMQESTTYLVRKIPQFARDYIGE